MKLEYSRQTFEKILNIKLNHNLSSGSRAVPCGRTDGQTDWRSWRIQSSLFAICENAHNQQLLHTIKSKRPFSTTLLPLRATVSFIRRQGKNSWPSGKEISGTLRLTTQFLSPLTRNSNCTDLKKTVLNYKVVQLWPGQPVTCLHTISCGHIWTTLYYAYEGIEETRDKVIWAVLTLQVRRQRNSCLNTDCSKTFVLVQISQRRSCIPPSF